MLGSVCSNSIFVLVVHYAVYVVSLYKYLRSRGFVDSFFIGCMDINLREKNFWLQFCQYSRRFRMVLFFHSWC